MHSASRDMPRYFEDWRKQADNHGFIAVVIEPLFDQMVEWADGQQQTSVLFGHSAGSQFAHR